MAFGMSFEEVMGMLLDYVRLHPESSDFRPLADVLPESWLEAYRKV